MKIKKFLALTTLCIITFSGIVNALPSEQNQLRIQMSESKRGMDTGFSTLVSWRKGDANLHKFTSSKWFNFRKWF